MYVSTQLYGVKEANQNPYCMIDSMVIDRQHSQDFVMYWVIDIGADMYMNGKVKILLTSFSFWYTV